MVQVCSTNPLVYKTLNKQRRVRNERENREQEKYISAKHAKYGGFRVENSKYQIYIYGLVMAIVLLARVVVMAKLDNSLCAS